MAIVRKAAEKASASDVAALVEPHRSNREPSADAATMSRSSARRSIPSDDREKRRLRGRLARARGPEDADGPRPLPVAAAGDPTDPDHRAARATSSRGSKCARPSGPRMRCAGISARSSSRCRGSRRRTRPFSQGENPRSTRACGRNGTLGSRRALCAGCSGASPLPGIRRIELCARTFRGLGCRADGGGRAFAQAAPRRRRARRRPVVGETARCAPVAAASHPGARRRAGVGGCGRRRQYHHHDLVHRLHRLRPADDHHAARRHLRDPDRRAGGRLDRLRPDVR